MIAESLNVGGGVRLIKPANCACASKTHNKHDADGRTVPGVCGNGSAPLSHSGNVVTRIGIHTHIPHGSIHLEKVFHTTGGVINCLKVPTAGPYNRVKPTVIKFEKT